MGYDNRIALKEGYCLTITDKNDGNKYTVSVGREIGRGGSCIVYEGKQSKKVGDTDAVACDMVIKEFYPKALDSAIVRNDDMCLHVNPDSEYNFKRRLELFCDGQAKHIAFANDNYTSALPAVSFSGEALGTFYSVLVRTQGKTLAETDRGSLKLTDALEIGKSVCDAIAQIHKDRMRLFLDCKPDNISVLDNRAYLFDFDTVQPLGQLRFSSYSPGWSAPEQEQRKDSGYIDNSLIGFHTDIYSIGLVVLYMLMGIDPLEHKPEIDGEGNEWQSSIDLTDETGALKDRAFTDELSRVMRAMLEPDAAKRKLDYGNSDAAVKAGNDFGHLLSLAENAPYRKGFDDTAELIIAAKESVTETIANNSLKRFLFGSKKRIIAASAILAVIALVFGILFSLGRNAADSVMTRNSAALSQDMDEHVLLKLSNANHQYEVGLENWRRLDYVRAERDILAARNAVSEETAQSEMDTAVINNSLGCLYIDMGKYAEAYDYLTSAYITFRDTLGENSIESRAVRASIAEYYYYTGKLDEALSETQSILDNSDPEKERAIIAYTSHLRAMIFDAQGRYDDALSLYSQVIGLYKDISEDGKLREQLADYANDPKLSQTEKDYYTNSVKWVILTYNNIAKVNIHKEDYEAATSAAEAGLELSLSNIYIGKRNLTTSKLYMNLAIIKSKTGDSASALDNIDLAMRIQRNLFDFKDVYPGLVEVYDIYGDLLYAKGDAASAKKYYDDAVSLAKESFGQNHPDTAGALAVLGNYWLWANEPDRASECLTEAIEIRKNILAEKHPVTAKMYYDLGAALLDSGDANKAEESFGKAAEICNELGVEGKLRDDIDAARTR